MQWHGHVGLVVWAAGLLNICVAVYGYFYGVNGHSYIAYVVWAGLAVVLVASVLTVLFDPDRSQAAQVEGWDGADARYGKFEDETMMGSLYESSPARGSMNSGI